MTFVEILVVTIYLPYVVGAVMVQSTRMHNNISFCFLLASMLLHNIFTEMSLTLLY